MSHDQKALAHSGAYAHRGRFTREQLEAAVAAVKRREAMSANPAAAGSCDERRSRHAGYRRSSGAAGTAAAELEA